jgi:chromatin segregation and condensation protein Rec8/ScpA/Scc1 (kleisin family)
MRLREDLFSRMSKTVIETVEDEEEFKEVGVYDLFQAFRNVPALHQRRSAPTVTAEGASWTRRSR